MITTAYASYMQSDAYRNYLAADETCRAAFITPADEITLKRARAKGLRAQIWTCGDLMGLANKNGEFQAYVSMGNRKGVGEVFVFERLVRNESLNRADVLRTDGTILYAHPYERPLNILVR